MKRLLIIKIMEEMLMTTNTTMLREKIKQRFKDNREALCSELKISSEADLSKLSDEQLEARVSPKLLGILGVSQEDLKK